MIGVLTRKDLSPSNKEVYVTYKAINDVLIKFKQIDKCDGIILQGGDDFNLLDLEIVNYIYEKDIPCLGICLGMQMMSYLFDGKIGHLINKDHLSANNYVHKVNINNSIIYDNKVIKVNSRHKDYVVNTKLDITGRSEDNIIEMVEDKYKTFFVGVQWHP